MMICGVQPFIHGFDVLIVSTSEAGVRSCQQAPAPLPLSSPSFLYIVIAMKKDESAVWFCPPPPPRFVILMPLQFLWGWGCTNRHLDLLTFTQARQFFRFSCDFCVSLRQHLQKPENRCLKDCGPSEPIPVTPVEHVQLFKVKYYHRKSGTRSPSRN